MAEEIILLSAQPYDMRDEQTGNQVKGLTIKYTYGEAVQQGTGVGLIMYDDNLPHEALLDLRVVPGFYEPKEEYRATKNARGKTMRVSKIVGLKFSGEVELVKRPLNGAADRNPSPNGRETTQPAVASK